MVTTAASTRTCPSTQPGRAAKRYLRTDTTVRRPVDRTDGCPFCVAHSAGAATVGEPRLADGFRRRLHEQRWGRPHHPAPLLVGRGVASDLEFGGVDAALE